MPQQGPQKECQSLVIAPKKIPFSYIKMLGTTTLLAQFPPTLPSPQ